MLLIALSGPELTEREARALAHPAISGVLLLGRNYRDRAQLKRLVCSIRKAASRPFLIAVDQEGGRVQRFREGFTCLPPPARYGQRYKEAQEEALLLAERAGYLMALELREVGVDLSLAPVLDLEWGRSSVIGDRAFGREPEAVAALAAAFRRGMARAGMAAVGKHFPGHGFATGDSHETLPVDSRPLAALLKEDLLPFKRLITEGIEAIMTAHLLYPEVDPRPATFSPFWLKELLRERLGFGGVVFSDDLAMEGAKAAGTLRERIARAREAGCDLLIASTPEVLELLEGLEDIPPSPIGPLLGRQPERLPEETLLSWRKALETLSHAPPPGAC